jgi:hypothetical protein
VQHQPATRPSPNRVVDATHKHHTHCCNECHPAPPRHALLPCIPPTCNSNSSLCERCSLSELPFSSDSSDSSCASFASSASKSRLP